MRVIVASRVAPQAMSIKQHTPHAIQTWRKRTTDMRFMLLWSLLCDAAARFGRCKWGAIAGHIYTRQRDTIYGMFILFCLCVCLLCVVMLRNKHTHTHFGRSPRISGIFHIVRTQPHQYHIAICAINQNSAKQKLSNSKLKFNNTTFLCASHKLYYTHNRKYYMQTLWSFSRAHFPLETN